MCFPCATVAVGTRANDGPVWYELAYAGAGDSSPGSASCDGRRSHERSEIHGEPQKNPEICAFLYWSQPSIPLEQERKKVIPVLRIPFVADGDPCTYSNQNQ